MENDESIASDKVKLDPNMDNVSIDLFVVLL